MTTPGMQGEVPPESMGKQRLQPSKVPPDAKPGHFRNYWNTAEQKSAKALHRKAVRAIERAGIGKSKRKFALNRSTLI
jgi:hypothetical protein